MTEIACAIFWREDRVLLLRRAEHKARFPDCWDLVGGHVEPGESVEAAMIREAEEEVGLTPTQFRKVAEYCEPVEGSSQEVRYHLFLVTAWRGAEPSLLGDEHTAMQWITPEQAEGLDMGHPQWRSIFHALRDEP